MRTTSLPQYLTLADAADLHGVTVRTLQRWLDTGLLTRYKLGPRLVRVDRAELESLVRPDGPGDLRAERLADYIERVVAEAPPLTTEQRERIAALLTGAVRA